MNLHHYVTPISKWHKISSNLWEYYDYLFNLILKKLYVSHKKITGGKIIRVEVVEGQLIVNVVQGTANVNCEWLQRMWEGGLIFFTKCRDCERLVESSTWNGFHQKISIEDVYCTYDSISFWQVNIIL